MGWDENPGWWNTRISFVYDHLVYLHPPSWCLCCACWVLFCPFDLYLNSRIELPMYGHSALFLVWPQRPSHLFLDGTTRLEFPRTYLLPGRLISVRRLVEYYSIWPDFFFTYIPKSRWRKKKTLPSSVAICEIGAMIFQPRLGSGDRHRLSRVVYYMEVS